MEGLQRSLHFGLEDQRQRTESLLLESMRSCATSNFSVSGWGRIVDLRYSLDPLSMEGSMTGIGGRFNVGAGLSPGVFTAFPALYCADEYGTAFLEKFGSPDVTLPNGLSGEDFALRKPGSFSFIRLNVTLENMLDISDDSTLKPMVEILREFEVPKSVTQTARKLGLKQAPWLIRSSTTLQKQLLHPNWRIRPMHFDLPANSQIFGRLVAAAGIHGILFPSSRDLERRCLALFPQNWVGSTSFIEIADVPPAGLRLSRRDGRVPL